MTIIEPNSAAAGIVERAKNLILTPSVEFDRIDKEAPAPLTLFTGYAAPLAAAAALASALGMIIFGVGGFGISYHPSPISALTTAIITFVLMLAGVWLNSRIIDFLAPNFGGQRNDAKATQVAVYVTTPTWLAGLFAIYPPLAMLGVLGLYSIYLLYRALPRLMKAPMEKAAGYTAAAVVCAIVLAIVLMSLTAPIMGLMHIGANAGPFAQQTDSGAKVTLPGGGELKLGELEGKAKDLQSMAKSMEAGKDMPAIPADALKALLPETLPGGFARTEISTGSGGAMGYTGTTAEAKYTRGDSAITLSVVDMGAAGALMGMMGALGVEASKEDAHGYSKTGKVNGRMTVEEADNDAKTAKYSVVAGDRVVLGAEGSGVTPSDVKAAVNAVGVDRAEALAKSAPKS